MQNRGFTLIEMAIVTMIIGILMIPLLMLYQTSVSNRQIQVTEEKVQLVSEALTEFAGNNNRYPCPASLILAPGDPNYGEPDCRDGNGWSGFTQPTTPGDCHAGICRTVGRDVNNDGVKETILIGAIPYMVMNDGSLATPSLPASIKNSEFLPGNASLDGWGNKFTYAVTEKMTDAAEFNVYHGAIYINDENDLSLLDKPGTAHFVIVSHGNNGMGGYSESGAKIDACDVNTIESDNCNQNISGAFVSALRSMSQGNDYYDDIIKYVAYTASTIWANVDEFSIYNAPGGRVAIGKEHATEMLDVAGNLQALQIHTKLFCGQGGPTAGECYDPSLIGGDKPQMQCPAGQLMTGIKNGERVCAAPPVVNGNASCSSGQVVVGMSNRGNVLCCPISATGVLQCP